jgi:hypothetical protein
MIFRYCRWERLEDALRMGWVVDGHLPGHHAEWSCAVAWLCECPAPWFPRRSEDLACDPTAIRSSNPPLAAESGAVPNMLKRHAVPAVLSGMLPT